MRQSYHFWEPGVGVQDLLTKYYHGDYTRLDPKMLKGFAFGAKGRQKLVRIYRNTNLILR